MSLFRRDPFFDDFFAPNLANTFTLPQVTFHHAQPRFYETDNTVTLTVDVPGVLAKDLQVQVEDNVLRVSGERRTAGSESKFVRSFSIDLKNVDVDNIKANLDCGVLSLTAPKRAKSTGSKMITVTESPMIEQQPQVTTPG